jgi:hypothetical protein
MEFLQKENLIVYTRSNKRLSKNNFNHISDNNILLLSLQKIRANLSFAKFANSNGSQVAHFNNLGIHKLLN